MTTTQERAPRIRSLALEAPGDALQGLLELAAEHIVNEGEGDLPPGSFELASQVYAAIEPDAPCFAVGEQVKIGGGEDRPVGKVTDRYLNEGGDWEYQVHHRIYGTNPFREQELAPVK